jgi:hypothetical protein
VIDLYVSYCLLPCGDRRAQGRAQLAEVEAGIAQLLALRGKNAPAVVSKIRQNKSSLKADLKKSTGLVKRFKNLTEESIEPIAKEIEVINLARYSSEVPDTFFTSVCVVNFHLISLFPPRLLLLSLTRS